MNAAVQPVLPKVASVPPAPWDIVESGPYSITLRAETDDLRLAHAATEYDGREVEQQKYVSVTIVAAQVELTPASGMLPPERIEALIAEGSWAQRRADWASTDFQVEVYSQGTTLYYVSPDRRLQCRDTITDTGEVWPNPFVLCRYRHPGNYILTFTIPHAAVRQLPWLTAQIIAAVGVVFPQ